jgi:hypothetical protein
MFAAILRAIGPMVSRMAPRIAQSAPKAMGTAPVGTSTLPRAIPKSPVGRGGMSGPKAPTPKSPSFQPHPSYTPTTPSTSPWTTSGMPTPTKYSPRSTSPGSARTRLSPPPTPTTSNAPKQPSQTPSSQKPKQQNSKQEDKQQEVDLGPRYLSHLEQMKRRNSYALGQQSLLWQSTNINNPFNDVAIGSTRSPSQLGYSPNMNQSMQSNMSYSPQQGTFNTQYPSTTTTPAVDYPIPDNTFSTYTPPQH